MNKRIISMLMALVMTLSLFAVAAVSAFAAEDDVAAGEVIYKDGKWIYVDPQGKPDPTYTGLSVNEAGYWYVEKGVVDFKTNGARFAEIDKTGVSYFFNFSNSKLTGPSVSYVQGGTYTLLDETIQVPGGWYYFDKDGFMDVEFTGFAPNSAGLWYVKEGEVTFKETSVIYDSASKNWYNVKNNKVTPGPTVSYNNAGWWYIDKSGKVDFKANTVAYNAAGWWACQNGKVTFHFDGLASNAAGTWVCQGSKVNFNYNGKYFYNDRMYNIKGGKVV